MPAMLSWRNVALSCVLVVGAMTVAVAAADVAPKLHVSPASPRVNQAVKITFHAPHALGLKHIFSVVIRGVGHCSTSAAKFDIIGPQRKNGRFIVILRPTDQVGPHVVHKWCRGKAKAKVVESKGPKLLGTVAVRAFRFRAAG